MGNYGFPASEDPEPSCSFHFGAGPNGPGHIGLLWSRLAAACLRGAGGALDTKPTYFGDDTINAQVHTKSLYSFIKQHDVSWLNSLIPTDLIEPKIQLRRNCDGKIGTLLPVAA